MMKRGVGLVLFAAMAAGLGACNETPPASAKTDPPRPVLVTTVAREPIRVERSFTATIRPRVESGLGFRIPGKVVRRMVENAQRVRQGEPLAELADADSRLQLQQAEAEARASAGSLTQAEAELRRALDLQRRGFAAEANIERVRAAADEARGRAERAKQAVELAANNLDYAVLRADADGIITAVSVEPGTVLAAGQVVFRVARTAEREAEIAVPEALLDKARRGQASVTIWSEPDKVHVARLRELSATADPVTRTYLARFSLPDLPDTVSLGMSATLTLAEDEREALVRIPLSAVRNVGNGPTVWVVDASAGKVAARPVTIARSNGTDVYVRSGLEAGDTIVRVGVHKLDPALPVRVVDTFAY
jgi:RND family efflux transporter MFP subunit